MSVPDSDGEWMQPCFNSYGVEFLLPDRLTHNPFNDSQEY
jgi:hypothetical protein